MVKNKGGFNKNYEIYYIFEKRTIRYTNCFDCK